MNLRGENLKMVGKLAVVTLGMFCFGYALVPIYKAICEITGINILSISETQIPGNAKAGKAAARSTPRAPSPSSLMPTCGDLGNSSLKSARCRSTRVSSAP